jgi:hypothetical protein
MPRSLPLVASSSRIKIDCTTHIFQNEQQQNKETELTQTTEHLASFNSEKQQQGRRLF